MKSQSLNFLVKMLKLNSLFSAALCYKLNHASLVGGGGKYLLKSIPEHFLAAFFMRLFVCWANHLGPGLAVRPYCAVAEFCHTDGE